MKITEGLMKWIYTFLLLGATIGWGGFTTVVVVNAMNSPIIDPSSVLEASGASLLMGALIVWNGNVNQHWFRKRGHDELEEDTIRLNRINKHRVGGDEKQGNSDTG